MLLSKRYKVCNSIAMKSNFLYKVCERVGYVMNRVFSMKTFLSIDKVASSAMRLIQCRYGTFEDLGKTTSPMVRRHCSRRRDSDRTERSNVRKKRPIPSSG